MVYSDGRITVATIVRFGTDALIDYLDLENKEHLIEFMVDMGLVTLELLADYLSEFTVICDYCGCHYANMESDSAPFCRDCFDIIRFNWD